MLDPKIQEAIDSLETINLNSFNGTSGEDLTTLTPSMLPTLTTAQLSALSPVYTTATGAIGQGYTISSGTASGLNWQSPNTVWASSGTSATITPAGKPGQLELRGENADLVVNGKSLMKMLERIEDRLNLLEPNTELEKDWDDLRRLGERYRRLEKKCQEKAETWKKLKAMTPPKEG